MEKAGFIRRIERRVIGDRSKTNLYDFAGLVKETTPFAMDELEQREQSKAERSARIRRKGKPKFKVDGMDASPYRTGSGALQKGVPA